MIEIIEELLPYSEKLALRDTAEIDLVVVHCTELPTLREAREYGERILYTDSKTGASGHYYVDRDGSIFRYVPDDRVAHHVAQFNERSLGLELVNTGRFPNWLQTQHQSMSEAYPEAQIECVIELVKALVARYPGIEKIAGHVDLDQRWVPAEDDPSTRVRRRIDPGPLFPWPQVLDCVGLPRIDGDGPAARSS